MSNEKLKIINKVLILAIFICIVSMILLVIFLSGRDSKGEASDTVAPDTIIDTLNSKPDASGFNDEEEIYSEHLMEISTPYCTLQYPDLWPENLKYTENNEVGTYSLTFYSSIRGTENEMFTIWFGAPESGKVIGYLDVDGTQVSFSVSVNDPVTDESWTEEEVELINSMTEGVNDIIVSVTSCDGFSKTMN